MNYPYYNPYQIGAQSPYFSRPSEVGQVYTQQQNVSPAPSVGQTQGISPASRPVSSKEEAMAVGADFSGAPMIFPDMAHNAVYMKRWDFQTGSATFTEFVPKESVPEAPAALYATQGDFRELADKLTERIGEIEAEIKQIKEGSKEK